MCLPRPPSPSAARSWGSCSTGGPAVSAALNLTAFVLVAVFSLLTVCWCGGPSGGMFLRRGHTDAVAGAATWLDTVQLRPRRCCWIPRQPAVMRLRAGPLWSPSLPRGLITDELRHLFHGVGIIGGASSTAGWSRAPVPHDELVTLTPTGPHRHWLGEAPGLIGYLGLPPPVLFSDFQSCWAIRCRRLII